MPNSDLPLIRLSPRLLSDLVWKAMFASDDERAADRNALIAQLQPLEALRTAAEYNTGSISFATAWSLYSLVRFYRPRRIIEIGTFIGRSTVAMASALDDAGVEGEIFTCDLSNALTLPWSGRSKLHQFQRASSTDMLRTLSGTFDLVFIDGRLAPGDAVLLGDLITEKTIIVLDDFEGMEKGVANLTQLRNKAVPTLARHLLIYPPSDALVASLGLTSGSLTALMIPLSAFAFASQ